MIGFIIVCIRVICCAFIVAVMGPQLGIGTDQGALLGAALIFLFTTAGRV